MIVFRQWRDRARHHFTHFRRAQEKKLMTSILNRLDALEAANQANAGSFADLGQMKTDIASLTDKVGAAATKDDISAVAQSVTDVTNDVRTIKAQIGPDPVQEQDQTNGQVAAPADPPVDNGGGEQQ